MGNKETSIGIKLIADLRNYQTGMAKAQGTAKKFGSTVKAGVGDATSAIRDLARGDISAIPRLFTAATAGTGMFSKGLHGVKVALISTGIGAIVVLLGAAIAGLTQYFKGTEEGQIVFAQVMNKIKAYTEPVLQLFGKLGKALVLLFSGKFGEAWDVASGAIGEAADQIKRNTENVGELNDLEAKLRVSRRKAGTEEKRLQAEIAEIRNKLNDEENYNAQQRLSFADQAMRKEKELTGIRLSLAGDELRLGQLKGAQGDNDIATNNELIQLEDRILEIKRQEQDESRRLLTKRQTLVKEAAKELDILMKTKAIESEKKDSTGMMTMTTRSITQVETQGSVDTKSMADMGGWLTANGEKVKEFTEDLYELDETQRAVVDSISGGFNEIGSSVVNSLGLAADGFEGFLGTLLQSVIKIISMMMANSMANVITGATAAGVATGPAAPFTTPAFIATSVAGILSAFAAIPKFAFGGVIPGTSFAGDNMLARVNSGEEILTANDPRHKNNYGGGGGGTTEVSYFNEAKIRGEDIYIITKKVEKRMNRRT